MLSRKKVAIEIATKEGPFSAADFSFFMILFRCVYVVAIEEEFARRDHSYDHTSEDLINKIIESIKIRFSEGISDSEIYDLARINLPEILELEISNITRRNPVEIVFVASFTAILVAAVIAGGGAVISRERVKIPDPKKAIENILKILRKK
ncbi:hypothetical protein [Janthinobacterium lividum]